MVLCLVSPQEVTIGDYNSDFNRGYNNYNGIGTRSDRPTNGSIDGEWAAWRHQQASIKPFPSASASTSPGLLTSVASSITPTLPLIGGGGYSGSASGGFWSFLFSIPLRLIKLALYVGFCLGAWGGVMNHVTPNSSYDTIFNGMTGFTQVVIHEADQIVPKDAVPLERAIIGIVGVGYGFIAGASAAVGNVAGHVGVVAYGIVTDYVNSHAR